MAIPKRVKLAFEDAFPLGAYVVSEVSSVSDFERSTRENKVQQVDPDRGLPLWQVDVLDADPEAKKSTRTVTVKIAAKVQPVPPTNDGSSPFTPVVFDGLTALPYIEENGNFKKISWSWRAESMAAPAKSGSRPTGDKAVA